MVTTGQRAGDSQTEVTPMKTRSNYKFDSRDDE